MKFNQKFYSLLAVPVLASTLSLGSISTPASAGSLGCSTKGMTKVITKKIQDNKGNSFGDRLKVFRDNSNKSKYCIVVLINGDKKVAAYSEGLYKRVNGNWKNVGGLGSGADKQSTFRIGYTVPKNHKYKVSGSVKNYGNWYNATVSIYPGK